VFCALLDHRRGGAFRLRPDGLAESRQYYHGDTGVLVTELRTGTGLLRVTDTLTLIEGADLAGPATARGELLRRLEVPHGSVTVELDVDPRGEVTVRRDGGGWRLHCDRWPDLVLRFAVTRPATRVPTARETHRDPVRARYTAGTAGGRALPDYTDEDGVDPDRRTETYARIDLTVDNWRWSGVRFVLRSGKALAADRTEVALHFHPVPHSAFPDIDPPTPNVLRLGLGPDRSVWGSTSTPPGTRSRWPAVSSRWASPPRTCPRTPGCCGTFSTVTRPCPSAATRRRNHGASWSRCSSRGNATRCRC
jgi:hypothetical protein